MDLSLTIDLKEFLKQSDLLGRDFGLADFPIETSQSPELNLFKAENLICKSVNEKEFQSEIDLEAANLKSLQLRKKNQSKKRTRHIMPNLEFDMLDSSSAHTLLNKISPYANKANKKLQKPDVVLKVHFYKSNRFVRPNVKYAEFEVLGQTKLTSLKDKLRCFFDEIPIGDFSKDPDAPSTGTMKDLIKSSFFFIEGTFYNDMRKPGCVDMSEPIRKWLEDKEEFQFDPSNSYPMESRKFIDLKIRLNHPYRYVHQGDCEHLICFYDCRISSEHDCQYPGEYPIEIFKTRTKRPACEVCEQRSKWVTVNSRLASKDPCYFCDLCLKMLLYDKDGNFLEGPETSVHLYPGELSDDEE